MAFNQFKLDKATTQSRGIFDTYVYSTTDSIAEVQQAGYFSSSRFAERVPDKWTGGVITCKCADGVFTIQIDSGGTAINANSVLSKQVAVRSPEDLLNIDSTILYFIDGVVDMTGSGISIEIPAGGFNVDGYNFNTSKIICTDPNYTLFTSPVGGSGDILGGGCSF